MASKWHHYCADCGRKNHINNDTCTSCDSPHFVKWRENIGKDEYKYYDEDKR